MKFYGKRVVSLLCALLMAIGLLSGVTLPAAVAASLTDGDVIVNLSWKESTVPATYTFQGKTYTLTWGVNAFSSAQTAADAAPAGANVILCPGTYSSSLTIKKNLQILGAKAGIDPNVRGASYTDDWTANPERGSSETIVTNIWYLAANGSTVFSDCTAVTVDGVTVSGDGQLRSNNGDPGYCTFTLRNLILKDCTKGAAPIYFRTYYGETNAFRRYITIENVRIEGTTTASAISTGAETVDISGVYLPAGAEDRLTDTVTTSWSDAGTSAVSFRIHDCMIRDAAVTRPIRLNSHTTAVTTNSKQLNRDLAEKARMTIIVDHNVFYNPDCGETTNNQSIAFAANVANVFVEITDNTFISDAATIPEYSAIAGTSTNTKITYGERVTIRKNRFIGVNNALFYDAAGSAVDLSGNYFESQDGVVSAPLTTGSVVTTCDWYYTDRNLVGKSTDPTPRFDQTAGDILVCSAWATSMPASYRFGARTYTLESGVNAFSDLKTAISAVPAGGTLIVAPGTYGAATFIKPIVIRGAMAGYSPNEEGATDTADWPLSAKWSGEQTIITGEWKFAADSVVDGVTLTGGGRLMDGGAADASFEWRDILITGYTGTAQPLYAYHAASVLVDRDVTIEDVRVEGLTTANCLQFRANDLTVRRVYMDDACNKKLMDGAPLEADTGAATVTISDCMLRTYTTQVINARARNNIDTNTNVDSKARVTINIQNNVFYGNNTDETSNINSLAIQWSSDQTFVKVSDNIFVCTGTPVANYAAIGLYAAKNSITGAYCNMANKFVFSRNRFINTPEAFRLGSYSTTALVLDGNYFETADGFAASPVFTGSGAADWYYLDRAMTTRSNGEEEDEEIPNNRLFDIENEVRWIGRTYVGGNGEHYFNWTNSGFEFAFYGTGATAQLESSNPGGTHTAYLVVYVDGVRASKDIEMNFRKATVVLADGLAPGNHTLKVVKRTNGRSSTAALRRLWVHEEGSKLAPPEQPCRKMQFIGASITVGYGTINTGASTWSTATEDGTVTFAALTAEYFGADNQTVAISGRGVVRNNGGDSKKVAPLLYKCIDYTMCPDYESGLTPGVLYDQSQYQADVVVIDVGGNDSTVADLDPAEFQAGCKAFIKQVRAAQPSAAIIYVHGFTRLGLIEEIQAAVAEVRAEGDNKVYFQQLATITSSEKYIGHPTAAAHADRAQTLIAKVAEVTGWKAGGGAHKWNSGVITRQPTCSVAGERTYTCSVCGDTKTEAITTLAHTWASDYTVDYEPTPDTDGQQSIHCTVCGAIKPLSEVVIPASYALSDMFKLSVTNSGVTAAANHRYSLLSTFNIRGTASLANAPHDVKVLEYGVLYGTSMDAVSDFVTLEKAGGDTSKLPVVRYIYGAAETGVTRLYSTFSYRFKQVNANRARGMALYIRYECDTEFFVEYSPVGGAATFVDGYINGVGPTIVETDLLDDPSKDSIKILAIGGSFSQDALQYLWQITKDGGYKNVITANLYHGGCTLQMHMNYIANDSPAYTYQRNSTGTIQNIKDQTLLDVLTDEDWDIITFQQNSGQSGQPATYDLAYDLYDFVKAHATNPKAKFYWHMTWAYQSDSTHSSFPNYNRDQMTMYNAIINAVNTKILPKTIPNPGYYYNGVIPCATSVQNLRTSYIGDTITRDGYHMTFDRGRYTLGLTWYCRLTGGSPDDITWVPEAYPELANDLPAIREAVRNAIATPYAVTPSTLYAPKIGDVVNASKVSENECLKKITISQLDTDENAPYFTFYNNASPVAGSQWGVTGRINTKSVSGKSGHIVFAAYKDSSNNANIFINRRVGSSTTNGIYQNVTNGGVRTPESGNKKISADLIDSDDWTAEFAFCFHDGKIELYLKEPGEGFQLKTSIEVGWGTCTAQFTVPQYADVTLMDVDTFTSTEKINAMFTKIENTPDNKDSLKILAIGNSFSQDATQYLWNIAKDDGYTNVTVGNLYHAGCTLAQHMNYIQTSATEYTYYKNTTGTINANKDATLLQALTDEDWDIITVQQASGSSGEANTYDTAYDLVAYVNEHKTNPNAKIYWHMTWAYQSDSTHSSFPKYNSDQMTMYNAILGAVQTKILPNTVPSGSQTFRGVIPCGTAIQNLRTSYIGDTLTRDGYHMSLDRGRYTVALTWYCRLTESNPNDITWVPDAYPGLAADLPAIREAVQSALSTPYSVTASTYTQQP